MLTIDRAALDQLASLLNERAGLKILPEGYHSLRLALSSRMPALGMGDATEYVSRLKEPTGEAELRSLLPLVTVGHTEFFRDPRQFGALEKHVLPTALARARTHQRQVTIWSAGCATGEEPYSLAIALCELGARAEEVDLWATDLNQAALENAKVGRYSSRRLAHVGVERRRRYFRATEEGHEISSVVKRYVRFEGLNLASPVFGKLQPSSLDLILCRNVIIYFDLPTIRGLMDRFLSALRPGGLLFLGYSESLFKVYDKFEMVEIDGAFVYRRPSAAAAADRAARLTSPGVIHAPIPHTPIPASLGGSRGAAPGTPRSGAAATHLATPAGGLGAVPAARVGTSNVLAGARNAEARASIAGALAPVAPPPRPLDSRGRHPTADAGAANEERMMLGAERESAASRTQEIPALSGAALARSPGERLTAAASKMDRGDFDGALADVQKLVREEPDDLDGLLTLGNLHALLEHHEAAAQAFSQALTREPLCVEARLFLGMASIQRGKYPEARSEFGKALFLEPTLALGHYLIAQVHERLKDREGARRSYRNAIAQLRHPQRPLAGHYPDMPSGSESVMQAARYALAALEES